MISVVNSISPWIIMQWTIAETFHMIHNILYLLILLEIPEWLGRLMLRLLWSTSPQWTDLSRHFGNLQLTSSVIADEGSWRLPAKHLERSVSLWASASEQPKHLLIVCFPHIFRQLGSDYVLYSKGTLHVVWIFCPQRSRLFDWVDKEHTHWVCSSTSDCTYHSLYPREMLQLIL